VQVGIVSWGSNIGEGCHSKYPSGFTDVAFMHDWIIRGIKTLLTAACPPLPTLPPPPPATPTR
jgi:secreted trypsin-like serine protease